MEGRKRMNELVPGMEVLGKPLAFQVFRKSLNVIMLSFNGSWVRLHGSRVSLFDPQ
jgi:hypothetical protein